MPSSSASKPSISAKKRESCRKSCTPGKTDSQVATKRRAKSAMSTSDEDDEVACSKRPRTSDADKDMAHVSALEKEFDGCNLQDAIEIEAKLRAVATKNHMNRDEMRRLLQKVVTNPLVLALVTLEAEDQVSEEERQKATLLKKNAAKSKLTRAWARGMKCKVLGNLPSLNEHKPDEQLQTFMQEELPSDDEDDEFTPDDEDTASDDEDTIATSDLDSCPRTPADATQTSPIKAMADPDGNCFKVPLSKESNDDMLVAARTRSKLSLQQTSLSAIQSQFDYPDVEPEPVPVIDEHDELYQSFLMDFTNSCTGGTGVDPDADDLEESDPEYEPDKAPPVIREEFTDSRIPEYEISGLIEEVLAMAPQGNIGAVFEMSGPGDFADVSDAWCRELDFLMDGNNQSVMPTPPPQTNVRNDEPQSSNCVNNSAAVVNNAEKAPAQRTIAPTQGTSTTHNTRSQAKNFRSKIVPAQNKKGVAKLRPVSRRQLPREIPNRLRKNALQNYNLEVVGRNYETYFGHQYIPVGRCVFAEYTHKWKSLPALKPNTAYESELVDIKGFTTDQCELLEQQLRIYTQLLTQTFVQTYSHPVLYKFAAATKDNLLELRERCSEYKVPNLTGAVELVEKWEHDLSDPNCKDNEIMMEHINTECDFAGGGRARQIVRLPPRIMNLLLDSEVFLYPQYLPRIPFLPRLKIATEVCPSEYQLIAMGLEEHVDKSLIPKRIFWKLMYAACSKMLGKQIYDKTFNRVRNIAFASMENRCEYNPINYYIEHKRAPPVDLTLLDYDADLTPRQQTQKLPKYWHAFLENQDWQGVDFKLRAKRNIVLRTSGPLDSDSERTRSSSSSAGSSQNAHPAQTADPRIVVNLNYNILPYEDPNKKDIELAVRSATNLAQSLFAERQQASQANGGANSNGGELPQIIYNFDPTTRTVSISQPPLVAADSVPEQEAEAEAEPAAAVEQALPLQELPDLRSDSVLDSELQGELEALLDQTQAETVSRQLAEAEQEATLANEDEEIFDVNSDSRTSSTKSIAERHLEAQVQILTSENLLLEKRLAARKVNQKRCRIRSIRRKLAYFVPQPKKRESRRQRISREFAVVSKRSELKKRCAQLLNTYESRFRRQFEQHKTCEAVAPIYTRVCAIRLYASLLSELEIFCQDKSKEMATPEAQPCTKHVRRRAGTCDHRPKPKPKRKRNFSESMILMLQNETAADVDRKNRVFAENFYDAVEEAMIAAERKDDWREFTKLLKNFDENADDAVSLYLKMEKLLLPVDENLAELLLAFLLPEQALEVGKFFEYSMISNAGTFVDNLRIFFEAHPKQLNNVYENICELAENPDVTVEEVNERLKPYLKRNPFLSDWLQAQLPVARPPDNLLPRRREKVYLDEVRKNETDIFPESIRELPKKLAADSKTGCRLRYIGGFIYDTPRVVLPAKLTFLAKELSGDTAMSECSNVEVEIDESAEVESPTCAHGISTDLPTSLICSGESICDDYTQRFHASRLNPALYGPVPPPPPTTNGSPRKNGDATSSQRQTAEGRARRRSPLKRINTPKQPKPKRLAAKKRQPAAGDSTEALSLAVPNAKKANKSAVNADSENVKKPRKSAIRNSAKAVASKIDKSIEEVPPTLEHADEVDDEQLICEWNEQILMDELIVTKTERESSSEHDLQSAYNFTTLADAQPPAAAVCCIPKLSPLEATSLISQATELVETKDELMSQCSSNGELATRAISMPWTKEEDRIILLEMKTGIKLTDEFVERLHVKLGSRTLLEVRERHAFLVEQWRQAARR